MSTRIAITVAFALSLAGPASADCNQELKALVQNVVAPGTGASTREPDADVLATKQRAVSLKPPAQPHRL